MTELQVALNEIADLKAQLAQSEYENNNLRNDNESLRDEITSQNFEIRNLEREIVQLEFEVRRAWRNE